MTPFDAAWQEQHKQIRAKKAAEGAEAWAELRRRTPHVMRTIVIIAASLIGLAVWIGVSIYQRDVNGQQGDKSEPSRPVQVSAGWTASRVGSLAATVHIDDGVSEKVAMCAAEEVAYVHTWLDWSALGKTARFLELRSAEADCR